MQKKLADLMKSKFIKHFKKDLSINEIQLIFQHKAEFSRVFEKDPKSQKEHKKVLANIKKVIDDVWLQSKTVSNPLDHRGRGP